MLKKLVILGLTVLTLFVFSATAYSQYNMVMFSQNMQVSPNATVYVPSHVWASRTFVDVNYYAALPSDPYYKYMNVSGMYKEETESTSGLQAAKAVYVTTQVVQTSDRVVVYRNYVRPSNSVATEEVAYLPPIPTTPSVNGKTSTFVAPFGYKTYTEQTKPVHPIRDFRADFWQDKYYRDEFHNHASYYQAYGMYNYWNSAASEESSDD